MEGTQKTVKKSKKNYCVYIPPPARKAESSSQQMLHRQEGEHIIVSKTRSEGKKQCIKNKLLAKSEENNPHQCHNIKSSTKDINSAKKSDSGLGYLTNKESHSKESGLPSSPTNSDINAIQMNSAKSHECQCSVLQVNVSSVNEIGESNIETPVVMLDDPKDFLCDSLPKKLNLNKRLRSVDDNHNKSQEKDRNMVKANPSKNTSRPTRETQTKPDLSVSGPISNVQCFASENQIFRNVWEKLLREYQSLETNPLTTLTKSRTVPKILNKEKEGNWTKEIKEGCIIEIHGFPEEFKTHDLFTIFSAYVSRGFKIRWVDDTHALGIFPSQVTAYEVLNTDLPSVKTRSLSEATPLSQEKAKQLMPPPPPPRPKTCSASARRLVSGALGIKAVFTQAEIEAEKEMLKEAREQRTLAKQKEAS